MRQTFERQIAGLLTTGTAFLALWGCEPSAPSVDTSNTPATVSGRVTIQGKAATKGTVTFNPANISRRDVPSATVDLGKDGSYKVSTLSGENSIVVDTPELQKNPTELGNGMTSFKAAAGENTFNIELPVPPPQ